ncbi:MAG: type 1 glutamine amidotransferase [Gammaproteobacteria bacterium]
MSARFLVFQHLDVEHPGIFRDFMRAEAIAWDTVELDTGGAIPPLDDYAALVVMGGPMDTWQEDLHPWLAAEKAAIRGWVAAGRPFLGVCLGHQLLAAALDGEVRPAARAEVGVCEVELNAAGREHPFFSGVPARFECLQWHGAEVARAPAGARVLASSPDCAVQALALGRHAFSFQFHVEVIDSTVDDWAAIPAYRASLERTLGPAGVADFRAATAARMQAFNGLARRVYDNWRHHAFA